jgi:hypothetical protein
MDRFDSDIIDRIVGHLPPGHTANWDWLGTASVLRNAPDERWYISRQWRDAIERRVFSIVLLESVEEFLSEFELAFAHPRRRAYLRQLHLVVYLVADSVIREGHEKNVAEFENTLHRLFATMHSWRLPQASGLRFELSFIRGEPHPLFVGHVFRYLRLLNHELPIVQCITDLAGPVMHCMPRIHPTAVC